MNVLKYITSIYQQKSLRTKNISKHIMLSLCYKIFSVLTSLAIVPIAINYLESESYGVWLGLTSFLSWFTLFDLGMGNALRNRFTEAKAADNFSLMKTYVSCAYLSIAFICLLMAFIFYFFSIFIDWNIFFNSNGIDKIKLSKLVIMAFCLFCMQMVLKLIITIYSADQIHSFENKVNFYISFATLIVMFIEIYLIKKISLFIFGYIISIIPVIILLFLNIHAFTGRFKKIRPSYSNWDYKIFKSNLGLSFNFFLIQIAGLVLFSTDNFIIIQLFGPADVIPYNITYKYFSISNIFFSIIVRPFWSSTTEAYVKNDYKWIDSSMKNLRFIALFIIFIIFIMSIFSKPIFALLLKEKIEISTSLIICMALYFSLNVINSPVNYFINGIGKIRVQMLSVIFSSIFNIPLSYFLASKLGLGTSGVMYSTILCTLPNVIFGHIQYNKIINRNASGIWCK